MNRNASSLDKNEEVQSEGWERVGRGAGVDSSGGRVDVAVSWCLLPFCPILLLFNCAEWF